MSIKDFLILNLLGALWGGSFLFMRVASPVLGPFLLIDLRVLIAGLVLLLYAWGIRQLPDYRKKWKQYIVLGAINAAIPFTLIAASELYLTASVSSILNATTPLFALIMARIFLGEGLSLKKVTGILLGIAGVGILVGWGHMGQSVMVLLSVLFSLLASLSYGVAGVYIKRRFTGEPSLTLAIGQQLAAGLVLIPFSLPASGRIPFMGTGILTAVLSLAILCTSFAYLLFFYLIKNVGPTKTLSVTLLVSMYGVLWGALFLGERLSLGTFIGLVIILSSITMITEVKIGAGFIHRLKRSR
ncbi:EamA/RhaT family transporter [Sporolactobacillus shoreae]|uniref:EamA/RhaT family transporter n=1 Tax=Sporolactobacillus shoreae TaxID=1465501 RepID=A0A4Z0GQB6_9BACL|nr:DMT family transporter [Sporolactobacillus shoreae]TGA98287.1 EamA/RhaT family transporter [Sporolactobacillus shoreae]